ncbi:hypothetical protein AB0J83_49995, partial [Actinoplanes sp. NPDC049596]
VSGLGDRPRRLGVAEQALAGGAPADRLPPDAFPADGGEDTGYRLDVARALVARAVRTAIERAWPAEGDDDAA